MMVPIRFFIYFSHDVTEFFSFENRFSKKKTRLKVRVILWRFVDAIQQIHAPNANCYTIVDLKKSAKSKVLSSYVSEN